MVKLLVSVFLFFSCCWHASCIHPAFTLLGSWFTPWGKISLCPSGHWAVGFKTKVEPSQGGKVDDAAMNGIGLICGDRKTVTSSVGPWGSWKKHPGRCSEGFSGARLKVERHQHGEDNTGTNSIQFICKSNLRIFEAKNGAKWGTWRSWGYCPRGLKIIGIQTMVEPKQGKGDDTALNSVRFFCGK